MRGLSKKQLKEWEKVVESKAKRKNSMKFLKMMNECVHSGENIYSMDGDYMAVHPVTGESHYDLFMKFITTNNPNFKLLQGE